MHCIIFIYLLEMFVTLFKFTWRNITIFLYFPKFSLSKRRTVLFDPLQCQMENDNFNGILNVKFVNSILNYEEHFHEFMIAVKIMEIDLLGCNERAIGWQINCIVSGHQLLISSCCCSLFAFQTQPLIL